MWNPVISQSLTASGITSRLPSYAHRCWLDFQTTIGNIFAGFLHVRFAAAIGGAGEPVALTYDATDGYFVATSTYAAALMYSFGGISLSANTDQSYGWIQCCGPNVVAVGNTGAITAGDMLEHNAAGVTVKAAATDAARMKAFMITTVTNAGDGTIGIGRGLLLNKF